jgi:lysophospholipase L1-like esterase
MTRQPCVRFVVAAVLACLSARTLAADPAPRVGKLPVGKVLFLGNSITLHGPAPQIGWTGNWGMAATAEEKDFVHLLVARLTDAAGAKPRVMVKNVADFERKYDGYDLPAGLKDELAFEADLVVIAIGENVPGLASDEAKAKYAAAFARLLAELQKHGHPAIIVRSSFWPDAAKDQVMAKACAAAGATFVDIGKLGGDPANLAGAERKIDHAGVAAHPGDKGMAAIADAIWAAIQTMAGTAADEK